MKSHDSTHQIKKCLLVYFIGFDLLMLKIKKKIKNIF